MANAASSDRVLHALREAKLQLESAKARAQEPLAIVGMACRFPGAHDVEAFWDVLSAGKDMTTAMPEDRWNVDAYYDPLPATPGKMYVRHGAFIDHVDQFDPLFFGISPREAASMDPQHRLLLEVSWEALERAGLAPTQLKGSQSGVFVGITGNDYARVEGDAEHIHGYAATGNYSFFASGRLSHVLGLQGPSLAIDTGCSASLVAVHAAMQSLRLGECDLALAGGVSLMLSPEAGIAFCQMQALAPDGRCKAFDATANGYGQGEGCGIVVLKRLSDAVADHDTILALLRGSAVNHDGPSSGLTVPSKLAQERVIRSALKNGNVDAHQVMYVDGHGAGTSLGDPIEVRALGDVFDVEQRQHPLMVGSVKTNIGHLEAAAGIASLIKVVLALQHHEMPPHLHFHSPSPHIDWDHLPIRVPTQPTPWPVGRRYGGVSSFGMGGTNGHLVIEEAPGEDEAPHAVMDRDWHILTLSAQSEPALNDLVDRFIDFLKDHPQAVLSDVCYTANVGRSDFAHRLSITATSIEQLRHKLSSFQNGAHRVGAGVSQGFAPDYQASPRIAMRFAGEGPLHVNMGRDLYETQPTFRQALDRCDALLRPMLTKSLLDVLYAGLPGRTTEGLADDAQLALFGFEYALATLWQSWGITPHLVIGDGVGEYVAACVAGVFSLEDALRLVTAHSRLARHHPQDGRQSEFEPMAQSVTYSRPRLELVSAPSAKRVTDDVMTADYWVRHAQQPLSHASGIVPLTDHGCHLVVDIGPTSAARPHVLEDAVTWLPSMQEGLSDWQQMLSSLGELYVRGADIDWAGFDQDYARRKEVLPTYPFQRQRYWADVVRKRRDHTRVRPLIDKMVKSPLLKETLFETEFSTHALPFLTDHRVYDQVVSAAACHLALVLSGWEAAYGAPEVLIETVFFPEALVVPDGESRTVQLVFEPEANAQHTGFGSTFQLISFTGEDTDTSSGDAPATHATGRLTAPMGTALAAVSLDEIQRRCVEAVDVETVYQTAERQQISLGSQFRWLEAIWRSERADEALGKLRPPPAVGSLAGYVLHPGLLDNCFQLTGVASAGQGTDDTLLPFSIATLRLLQPIGGQEWWCHVRLVDEHKWNLRLLDETGHVMVDVVGFEVRRAKPEAVRAVEPWRSWLYEPRWQPRFLIGEPISSPAHSWVLFADETGMAEALAKALHHRGQQPIIVSAASEYRQIDTHRFHINPNCASDYPRLFEHVTDLYGVVHLWSLDEQRPATVTDLEAAEARHCGSVLHLTQTLLQPQATPSGLWLVTRDTQAVIEADAIHGFAQAAIWGMGRVIIQEHPELYCVCLDLGADTALEEEAQAICAEMMTTGMPGQPREDQVAFRDGARYVARLARYNDPPAPSLPPEPYQLDMSERGAFDNFEWRPQERQTPGPREVEIRVWATGLNFRDVLNALGLYPGDAGLLGCECAGEVVAIGRHVEAFAIGDRVLSLVSGGFGQYATVREEWVARMPRALNFEEAATIPIAFLTAFYCLHRVAQIRPGARVLIHSAAGGVGQAAIQLVQAAGGEVFGTASSGKWATLKALGVEHLYHSRTLDFASQVLADTDGQGVDVVLNSLTGEGFIEKSLATLAPHGHFIETSKRGVWDARQMATLRPDVSYALVDLDDTAQHQPNLIQAMLQDLCDQLEAETLKPLPQTIFPLHEVADAFDYMQQAKHTGKIVLSQSQTQGVDIRQDVTYLITGGLGGLGLLMAHWLAAQGATHLILIGHRPPQPETQRQIDELSGLGADVTVAKADVAAADQVARVLAHIPANAPLRGIIHAAGVLDDGAIFQQNWNRFANVMSPKVSGAWNLHTLTQEMELDFFVLFSSSAGLLGNPGQANYAAANVFLDALAHHRHAQRQPALSINWDAWSTVGMAAELVRREGQRMRAQGLRAIPPERGVSVFAHLLQQKAAQIAVLSVDWSQYLCYFYQQSSLLAGIRSELNTPQHPQPKATEQDIRRQLEEANDPDAFLAAYAQGQVSDILRHPASELDMEQPLTYSGLDSLMAIKLSNQIRTDLGMTVSALDFLKGLNLVDLVTHLHQQLLFNREVSPSHGSESRSHHSGEGEWVEIEI